MRVLAVSTWGTACGIANHTQLVKEAIEAADPSIEVTPDALALDPQACFIDARNLPDVVWLNHHDALHSRWTTTHIQQLKAWGVKVLVTYHDTRETLEPGSKLAALAFGADHTIVHEPVAGLTDPYERGNVTYLRQGIPTRHGHMEIDWHLLGGWDRPVLGTVGFDFPWKNYDRLAALTAEIGWGFLLICPNLTEARAAELKALNPWLLLPAQYTKVADRPVFLSTDLAVMHLAGCTATAFMYECANTGTSGAIRLGIAARKPVYALASCRQFRDLLDGARRFEEDTFIPFVYNGIRWVRDWNHCREWLTQSLQPAVDTGIVYLAERDSMAKVGAAYAHILRRLTGAETVPAQ